MALTNCLHCRSEVPATSAQCPQCGRPTGNVWGSCPECAGPITPDQESCKGCGFPLRPSKKAVAAAPAPAAAPPPPPPPPASRSKGMTSRRSRRRASGRPLLQPGEEPPAAMIFAVIGLLVPIFALLGLAQSKRGTAARRLSWIGIALWIAGMIFIFAVGRSSS